MATEAEIAWAAGVFEGEGSISHARETGVSLHMGMTDLDTVTRFQAVVGAGGVCTMHGGRAKPIHVWNLGKRVEVQRILTEFLPWLGARRTARAQEALSFIASFHRSCDWADCGVTYLAGRTDRLYCSNACAMKAKRAREQQRVRVAA